MKVLQCLQSFLTVVSFTAICFIIQNNNNLSEFQKTVAKKNAFWQPLAFCGAHLRPSFKTEESEHLIVSNNDEK